MTLSFSVQLASLGAACFFLCFLRRPLSARLCCVFTPSSLRRQGQNAAEQQTQIVAINFRLVYGVGLLAHLGVNP